MILHLAINLLTVRNFRVGKILNDHNFCKMSNVKRIQTFRQTVIFYLLLKISKFNLHKI